VRSSCFDIPKFTVDEMRGSVGCGNVMLEMESSIRDEERAQLWPVVEYVRAPLFIPFEDPITYGGEQ